MKILVTGAKGFVGKNLVANLKNIQENKNRTRPNLIIDEIFEYDGSQINPSWAFQEFSIYGSSIITWIGPVNITPDNLKDFADVGLEIKSNYMVNFICEFFVKQEKFPSLSTKVDTFRQILYNRFIIKRS